MLESHEELWSKELPEDVERLLVQGAYNVESPDVPKLPARDKTRVVTWPIPHNAAVQIYDYKAKKSRVEFGPGLVILSPEEMFTVLSLSGSKPKRPNLIKSLSLNLGPDYFTDIFLIETSDHARLNLQLSYNWYFDVDRSDSEDACRLFSVRDFVGDACKALASRVRNAVAAEPFDSFHQNSAKLIRRAVFGVDANDKVLDGFRNAANGLVVTNVDIQSVEPVDQRTRESLQKSVQLAIEITTKNLERKARHQAEQTEQEARGKIEGQKIKNSTEAESLKQTLVKLQAESGAIASTGTAKAEAMARSEFLKIEGESEVKLATLKASASDIEVSAELEQLKLTQDAEMAFLQQMQQMDVSRNENLAQIEAAKFKHIVAAIGPKTIQAIARAGPELQSKLLKSLGLKGYLVTDGTSPINLFQTASGMVGSAAGAQF